MAKTKQKAIHEPFNLKKELRNLPGYLVLFAWFAFTVCIIGWILLAAVSTTKEIFSDALLHTGVHFENFVNAWTKGKFSVYFANSILYTFGGLVGALLVSAPAAYVLSRFRFTGSKIIQRLFVMSMSVPPIMIMLPLFGQAVQWNLINSRLTLIVIYICINVPYTTFFLINFFATISTSFEEAAAIDGCTPRQTFFKIMLPLAQPGIITVGIFLFVNLWNEYIIALFFAQKTELRPLGIGLTAIVQSMRTSSNWSGLFASVVIVVVPTFILYLFLSQKIIAGITGGGVKE